MKTLTVYFSRAGENYVSGQLRRLAVGNTEKAARIIQKVTDGDLFSITMKKPYADDYNTCIEEARRDLRQKARPALVSDIDTDEYDVMYLGFPIYWGTMPMAVCTFLERHDFKGKVIYPFVTHEGSGFASSLSDLKKEAQGAEIGKGLALHGTRIDQSAAEIRNWVKETL